MKFTGKNQIIYEGPWNQLIDAEYIDNDNNTKQWQINKQPDSVSVLVENTTNKTFILVQQYRPPIGYRGDKNGQVIELVAGLVDKDGKDLIKIASEEVEEETGYTVDSIQFILESPKSAGQTTSFSNDFFATVSGNPGPQNLGASEEIIVHEVEKKDIFKFLDSQKKQGINIDSSINMHLGEYARMKNPAAFMNAFE